VLPIAVDAMGGDNAPKEIVEGARQAVEELGLDVVLVGQPAAIGDAGGLEIIPASEVIGMRDDPAQVHAVLDAQMTYLEAIGAIGPVDPPEVA